MDLDHTLTKRIFYFLMFFIVGGCQYSKTDIEQRFLYESSRLEPLDSVVVREFIKKRAGLIEEVSVQAIYEIDNLENELIKTNFAELGYKALPANELDLDNSFHGFITNRDKGYYLIEYTSDQSIKLLVIINFSNDKILVYKS